MGWGIKTYYQPYHPQDWFNKQYRIWDRRKRYRIILRSFYSSFEKLVEYRTSLKNEELAKRNSIIIPIENYFI